jgi:hypothetical protein
MFLGDKIADAYIARMKIAPERAQQAKLGFKIGVALVACGGGVAIANTTLSKLSKKGKADREKELVEALNDAQPRNYCEPERPALIGSLKPQGPLWRKSRSAA